MKEFEKWRRNNWDELKQINPYPYSNLLSTGWEAALEWVSTFTDSVSIRKELNE